MRVTWNGQSFDCETKEILPSSIREGDFLLYKGQLCWVETIQRGVPRIENLHRFTMFTLRNRAGDLIAADDVFGTRDVFRETWQSKREKSRERVNA